MQFPTCFTFELAFPLEFVIYSGGISFESSRIWFYYEKWRWFECFFRPSKRNVVFLARFRCKCVSDVYFHTNSIRDDDTPIS